MPLKFRLLIIFYAFAALAALPAIAQDETVHLEGVVVSADSLEPLPFTHIVVKSRGSGTIANENGKFRLDIPRKDTLVFSFLGYHNTEITFNDSVKTSFTRLSIFLYPKSYTLKPVNVYAYDLEKILQKKSDPVTMERQKGTPLFEEKETRKKNTVGFGVNPNGGAYLEGGLTALANLFNNEHQQMKKLDKLLEEEAIAKARKEEMEFLTNKYLEIVMESTRLDGADLDEFVEYYHPSYDFLREADTYNITLLVVNDYRDFLVNFRPEKLDLDELLQNAEFEKGETGSMSRRRQNK
jgi:hypothetical protein